MLTTISRIQTKYELVVIDIDLFVIVESKIQVGKICSREQCLWDMVSCGNDTIR